MRKRKTHRSNGNIIIIHSCSKMSSRILKIKHCLCENGETHIGNAKNGGEKCCMKNYI